MCHVSHVTCHVSPVICHVFCGFFNKLVELVDEGYVINEAYPVWFICISGHFKHLNYSERLLTQI